MNRATNIILWICRIVAAIIMLQTLFFKFSGASESVYIFTTVGMEPWGRYGSGIAEGIAAILLLIPRYSWLGALIGLGVISGAIFFHLTTLGIEVMGDGGLLFLYAIIVFICCLVVAWLSRRQIPVVGARLVKHAAMLLLGFLFFTPATAQRKVLVEQFSNASCSVCGQWSPQVYSYAELNSSKVAVITYHTSFPYTHDSMHYENPADANARVAYYSVTGTPTTVMDGNFYKNATANLVGSLPAKVDERILAAPGYTISISNFRIENGEAKARVIFTSAAANDLLDLNGYIVLVEKVVPKTAYIASPGSNSETEYKNVMRRMHSSSGQALQNRQNGGSDTIDATFATANVKSMAQLRIVAFVQNNSNKEVQAAATKDLWATGIPSPIDEKATWLYDAAAKQYILNFPQTAENGIITVLDITGREVLQQNAGGDTIAFPVGGLKQGIYLATFSTGNANYFSKIIVP